jgi:hypothetical protein
VPGLKLLPSQWIVHRRLDPSAVLFNARTFPQLDKFAPGPFEEDSDFSQSDNDDICLFDGIVSEILARGQAFSDSPIRLQRIKNVFAHGRPTIPKDIGTEMTFLIAERWNSDLLEQLSPEEIVDELRESAVWDFTKVVGSGTGDRHLHEIGEWEAANCPS